MKIFRDRKELELKIELNKIENRRMIHINHGLKPNKLYLFNHDEPISGVVSVIPYKNRIVKHKGLKVTLLGLRKFRNLKENDSSFMQVTKELDSFNIISQTRTFYFEFSHFDSPYESYYGNQIQIIYLIELRLFFDSLQQDKIYQEIYIIKKKQGFVLNEKYLMVVGIEDLVNLDLTMDSREMDIKDWLSAKLCFKFINIRIKQIELHLIRKEYYHSNVYQQIIQKYEVIDGQPNENDTIRIRMHLRPLRLTPTIIDQYFKVQYYVSIVIIDNQNRNFFKNQEIFLYRCL